MHPYASPALGDLSGLPPLYITVCEQECVGDDAYAVVEAARRASVPVTLNARVGLVHVWPILVPVLPEAREDLRHIVRFIRGTAALLPRHAPPRGARTAGRSTQPSPR